MHELLFQNYKKKKKNQMTIKRIMDQVSKERVVFNCLGRSLQFLARHARGGKRQITPVSRVAPNMIKKGSPKFLT